VKNEIEKCNGTIFEELVFLKLRVERENYSANNVYLFYENLWHEEKL